MSALEGAPHRAQALVEAGHEAVVFYCNGPWCGQSPTNIKQLVALGYPAHKLKWYRGGMQDWKSLGLTTAPWKRK